MGYLSRFRNKATAYANREGEILKARKAKRIISRSSKEDERKRIEAIRRAAYSKEAGKQAEIRGRQQARRRSMGLIQGVVLSVRGQPVVKSMVKRKKRKRSRQKVVYVYK